MRFGYLKHKNGLLWLVFCVCVVIAMGHYGAGYDDVTPHPYAEGFLERLDAKGHAIENHVGQTDAFLLNRLKTEDISAASTFNTYAEAESAIRNVLYDRQSLIQKWLDKGQSDKKSFYTPFHRPVGRILKRDWDTPRPGNQVRVVLVRDGGYRVGFFILTAYPEYK